MRRFMLFGGDHYYPVGGWHDFRKWCDTLEEAREAGAEYDWFHVVDTTYGPWEVVDP